MPKKKTQTGNTALAAEIKKEMVGYIGPIFEELKTGFHGLKTEMVGVKTEVSGLKTEIRRVETSLTKRIDDKTHRLEVLMDHTKQEVMKDHESRIRHLERDFQTVKKVIKESKI